MVSSSCSSPCAWAADPAWTLAAWPEAVCGAATPAAAPKGDRQAAALPTVCLRSCQADWCWPEAAGLLMTHAVEVLLVCSYVSAFASATSPFQSRVWSDKRYVHPKSWLMSGLLHTSAWACQLQKASAPGQVAGLPAVKGGWIARADKSWKLLGHAPAIVHASPVQLVHLWAAVDEQHHATFAARMHIPQSLTRHPVC